MTEPRRPAPEFDLVLWGATGFTGRLVAEYLLERYGADGDLRWAMGGRDHKKLEEVRSELGAGAEAVPLVLGDARDEASLESLVRRAAVVCSTVGPYAVYGSELVAACARHGTHYCDLTGELQWMRRMIDAHQAEALASGARIVHACGFDSIPSDLGCLFVQQEMQRRYGAAAREVRLGVRSMRGSFSGGTVASLLNVLEETGRDRTVARVLADPYALNPEGERNGPDGPDQRGIAFDAVFDAWTAPFVMAAVNTRVVRRTNALLDFSWGRDFRYSEAMLMGSGMSGWLGAAGLTAGLGGFLAAASLGPARRLLQKRFLPKPGEGPSREARERGGFDLEIVGTQPERADAIVRGRVQAQRDPGYGATARMLGEAAVCLAKDEDRLVAHGGFWTPASAMGNALIERLQRNAEVKFTAADR